GAAGGQPQARPRRPRARRARTSAPAPSPTRGPLVVRGAVPVRACFPVPLSIRACGFPAHGLQLVCLTWLRRLRVADGAHELIQAMVVEPGARPEVRLAGTQVTAALLDQQAFEPPCDVPVE